MRGRRPRRAHRLMVEPQRFRDFAEEEGPLEGEKERLDNILGDWVDWCDCRHLLKKCILNNKKLQQLMNKAAITLKITNPLNIKYKYKML